MATRKKTAMTTSSTPAASDKKLNRSKVSKSSNAGARSTRTSGRLSQKNWDRPVVQHKNGLVDVSAIPDYLVSAVERNATSSPLLRLPGELRNKIYALAIGKHYAKIKRKVYSETAESYFVRTVGYAQVSLQVKTCQPTAFHLPEVCRQIYCDTAIMAYQRHIFIVDSFDLGEESQFIAALLPAQRNAVVAVGPKTRFFESYVSNHYGKVFRKRFPGLKRIEVAPDALSLIQSFNRHEDKNGSWSDEEWKQWAVEKVQQREGDDVEVVFTEKEEVEETEA
ncbi:hypothetical protein CC86DRAFT_463099 [Ophiobolus disseminans]|uniref:Uncharacterized protein n=1 Tax=Ophiobolus disseminans TaxID=1469910 RepID=A0A6A7ACT2_9PLEO|nr:hypothetical protein CC86DRAFT_463099 [Ophiobolus disseminans]